jgi:cytochrome c-type biogenesis protein CcmE
MATRGRLILAATIVASAIAYMAYVGGSADWQYYLTVDECMARGQNLLGSRIRVSGSVASGTLSVAPDRIKASFHLLGTGGNLPTLCNGPIPGNLTENMAVVVEGHLDDHGVLIGSQVLTRCARKYETRAVASGSRLQSQATAATATRVQTVAHPAETTR